jgi:ribosome modulation factor
MKKTMLRFFAQLSGKGKPPVTPPAPKDNPATIQEGSENGMRRQLVQVLLRDLLRKHGIPAEWIDCQMLIVSSRTKGSGMYVRLVVQHWDERLMNYAAAFQKELIAEIKQFEPQAANWLHGISWQLEVDDSCPYTTLPGRSFWLEPKVEATPEARPTPKPQPEQPRHQAERQAEPVNKVELETLFAIRDRALSAQADHGLVAAGYEKTQPAPL